MIIRTSTFAAKQENISPDRSGKRFILSIQYYAIYYIQFYLVPIVIMMEASENKT